MNIFKREFIQSLKTLALALVLSVGVSYVSAWTGPTAAAPDGNVSAPLNVSATAQTKTGGINFSNYAHFTGYGTDSWFPYTNGANYLRGTLYFNSVLYDENNTGYYLDPNGTNRLNYTVNDNSYNYGWTQADVFYDRYNNGYYMQPRGTNRLNYVVADNVHVYGTIRGGSYGFGGMYVDVDGYCTGINGRVVNPFTGWCNCPAGFADANLSVNQGGNFVHICYK